MKDQAVYSYKKLAYLTAADRYEIGRSLQEQVPLASHADWSVEINRPDPAQLIEQQNETRISWLVPVRRSRMSISPFKFYRGTARIMAHDLSKTPVSGILTQICGDAHLSNFGIYASPERNLVFDLNDFDETLLGPWEWDIKRLATSFIIAGRHNGFDQKLTRNICKSAVSAYRNSMKNLSDLGHLDIWYSKIDLDKILEQAKAFEEDKSIKKLVKKVKNRDHLHSLDRLAEKVNGKYRIKSEIPLLMPSREIPDSIEIELINDQFVLDLYNDYVINLPDSVEHLLQNYQIIDHAIKVVGVGSVGTLCLIILLQGRDHNDPFFLQIKQANNSVLEEVLSPGKYSDSGRRVVEGQRLMQTVSDIFLGWTASKHSKINYYWRQLKDWKGSQDVEKITPKGLEVYANITGRALARAHARSGDPIAISAYLGDDDIFDESITVFAEKYSDQTEKDYLSYKESIIINKLELRSL